MTNNSANCTQTFDELRNCGWEILLAARAIIDAVAPQSAVTLNYNNVSRQVDVIAGVQPNGQLFYGVDHQWRYAKDLPDIIRSVFDLYLPVLGTHTEPSVVVGHLGQSVDARIATLNGDAFFVTGEENRDHLHRMRALCHAVLVGAETVLIDNPQLNTRTVSGPSPIRVVVDPRRRVPATAGILHDGAAPTWLFHSTDLTDSQEQTEALVQRIILTEVSGRLLMTDIIDALKQRGVTRLFVEGGGVLVSTMLTQNCLHLLQVAAAPLLVGDGRPAIQLPGVHAMKDALRPPFQLYRMGEDVMWNFNVRNIDVASGESKEASQSPTTNQDIPALQRLL